MNYYIIELSYDLKQKERLKSIQKKIISEFEDFKSKNELLFCTLHIEKLSEQEHHENKVCWNTTIKYKNEDNIYDKIYSDFEKFLEENNLTNFITDCQISKISFQENTVIVEYAIHNSYFVRMK